MLILVQKGGKQGGFFLKRKARKGKLPPVLQGIRVGGRPCVLLKLFGDITPGNQFLAPYLDRGDVVILSGELQGKLRWNTPYIEEYARRQCVNFVRKALGGSTGKTQTVLIDPKGVCMGVAVELTLTGTTLWVVTPNQEAYLPCQEYTGLMFGNPPIVTDRVPDTAHLVVAPYGAAGQSLPTGAVTVAPDRGIWAQQPDLCVPNTVTDTLPEGFDPVAVAAGCMVMFGGEWLELTPQQLHLGERAVFPDALKEIGGGGVT